MKALANCKRRFVDIEASSKKEEVPLVRNDTPSMKKQGLFASSQQVDPIVTICQLLNIRLPSEAERKRLELKYWIETVSVFNIRNYYPEIKDRCNIDTSVDVEKHLNEKLGEKGFSLLKNRFDNMYSMIRFLKNSDVISQHQYDVGVAKIVDEMISTIKQNLQEVSLKK